MEAAGLLLRVRRTSEDDQVDAAAYRVCLPPPELHKTSNVGAAQALVRTISVVRYCSDNRQYRPFSNVSINTDSPVVFGDIYQDGLVNGSAVQVELVLLRYRDRGARPVALQPWCILLSVHTYCRGYRPGDVRLQDTYGRCIHGGVCMTAQ